MASIDDIVKQVKDEDRAKRDADLETHHRVNAQIKRMFDELTSDVIGREYEHPRVDMTGPVSFEVAYGDGVLCTVRKGTGLAGEAVIQLDVKMETEQLIEPYFTDPERVMTVVVRLLQEHKRGWSSARKPS